MLGANISVDFSFSLFDFLIVGTLGWGIYKGYRRGFFVQVISFFALLISIFITVKLIDSFHVFLSDKSTVGLAQLPAIVFAIFFVGIVYGMHKVGDLVEEWTESVELTVTMRVLGSVFSAVKYTFLIGIVLILLYRLDTNFDFITKAEKDRTNLFKPFRKLPPVFFPYLKFNTLHYQPYLLPDDENSPETDDKTDPFGNQDDF